ncbi:hypothetical protein P4637_00985 [Halalkalibacterium halodurans]|jgi:hypothetical protein|uniref:BH1710 protein n=2 Tax=Halalkalibacterium halodurans TaxID=86665 RepID=Q9KC64_HALH5|nr:hypothetical protein [Halalkalibacterium halodurans]MED4082416.1 hypothetical protein [Halalkalibacterium halodurans]MED4083433.1 hypothetical protein [Halalkalibacterium halodurans]MED4105746.1 hypothetical protein [Halalkalibacterium halodurans]MED4109858.1 hypothetical protein [Halalkalibacterium halodurans]MED4149199.1 hypothetical protein [Halalkalibacterium halodurans]
MAKWLALVPAFVFTFLLVPVSTVLAAGGGGHGEEEAAAAEPTILTPVLMGLSFVTIIVMIFYMFRDNG